MKLAFDLSSIAVVEFGLGRDGGEGQIFVMVPVDGHVQDALIEMVQATRDALREQENGPQQYEPSEKHSSTEYLILPLADDLAAAVRVLHQAENLQVESGTLREPSEVFCYFTRLTDKEGNRLTGLRRATQFKGVLKKRLLRLTSDSLQLIEDTVFKLDSDFDLLIDAENVHILRPSGFEFAGKLQQAILDAVPENIEALKRDLSFVSFESIQTYAVTHPRAARYLASIRSNADMKRTDKRLLKDYCRATGVEVSTSKGKLIVAPGHELGFLEVLDRRRFEVNLVRERPERYRAASRERLSG